MMQRKADLATIALENDMPERLITSLSLNINFISKEHQKNDVVQVKIMVVKG